MTEKEKEGLRLIQEYHVDPDRKIDPAARRAKELVAQMSPEERKQSRVKFQQRIKALRQKKNEGRARH